MLNHWFGASPFSNPNWEETSKSNGPRGKLSIVYICIYICVYIYIQYINIDIITLWATVPADLSCPLQATWKTIKEKKQILTHLKASQFPRKPWLVGCSQLFGSGSRWLGWGVGSLAKAVEPEKLLRRLRWKGLGNIPTMGPQQYVPTISNPKVNSSAKPLSLVQASACYLVRLIT